MKAANINQNIVDAYLGLLQHLSPGNKLDLIAKLTQSVKADMVTKNNTFKESFGAWEGDEKAEELAERIKSSRRFNRQIEEL